MSPADTAVQNWLSSRNINVLPEWIQACLEWIHNEYQGQDLPGDQLKDMVYEQWLDSDLTEIATPSLPQGLAQQEKITIQGSFTLQINSFQDVGSSAYSQLIKIKGKENENVAVSATQATQNRFEPKPNRMLMMEITDGHQTIQAMEYQSIPALTPDTPPGTKILMQGTIMCRLGVLTLTSRHVKILGGEVETLIEENNQEKLLARLLGTSLDDLPQQSARRHPVDDRTTGGPGNQGTSRPEQSYDNKYSTSAQNSDRQKSTSQMQSSSSYQIGNQGFPDSVPQSAGNQRQSSMSHQSRSSQWQSSSSHHASNGVVPDINIQQSTGSQRQSTMSHQSRSHQMQSGSFQNSGKQMTKHSDSLETSSGWVKAPSKEDVKFEDDLDAIDEDILREFEEAQYQEMSKGTDDLKKLKSPPDWPIDEDCQSKPPPDWPSDEDTDEEMLAAMIDKLEEQIKARDKEPKKVNKVKDSSKGPHKTQAELKISRRNKVNALSCTAVKSKPSSTQKQTSLSGFLQPRQSKENPSAHSSEVPVDNHRDTQLGKLSLKRGGTSQFVKAKQIQPTDDRTFASKKATFQKEIDTSSDREALQGDGRKEERTSVQITTEPAMKFSSPQRTAIRPLSVASPHHPKVAIATRITKEDCSEMAAKRRRLSSGKDSTQEMPFTYLAEKMDSIRANQQPVTFVIRAFIMTLLSALGKRNDCWSLQVRLNDGSGSLDAVLSDQVLQSLIGYSVTEMKQMRLSVKNDQDKAAVEVKQKTALERCRRRLIDLCEIMTIRVNPGEEMPVVMQIRRVEQRDCQQMKRCLLPL